MPEGADLGSARRAEHNVLRTRYVSLIGTWMAVVGSHAWVAVVLVWFARSWREKVLAHERH